MRATTSKKYVATEHQSQSALMMWWDIVRRPLNLAEHLLFAVPNGGKRDVLVAKKLKIEGVRAGVADLVLAVPKNDNHGFFLEMKRKGNKPTEEQSRFGASVQAQGYKWEVAYSTEHAANMIAAYLGIKSNVFGRLTG